MALIQNNAAEKTSFLDFQVSAPAKTDSSRSFDKVMQSTKNPSYAEKQDTGAAVTGKQDADKLIQDKLAVISSKTQDKLTVSQSAEAGTEEALEVLGTLMADIRELLMETFQVSEQELSAVMTELGMTDADLLNPQAVDQLAVALTGAEDAMELLFQPDFMKTMKELTGQIGELKEEAFASLGMTEKQVTELFAELQPQQEESRETEPTPLNGQTTAQEPAVEIQNAGASQTKKEGNADSGAEKNNFPHMPQTNAVNPVLNGMEQALEAALPEAEAADVVRQLVNQIKVTVTEDTTSFEMQLNPEHLGKINLQVVARDGAVTAQIAAENAAVKEVLESQIAVLKESLNNQGIKIEAVEVTIASHEFERNLDSQQDEGQQQESSQKRRFRFDVMEAAEEELTPADMLMRDMMLADGNQINYMA